MNKTLHKYDQRDPIAKIQQNLKSMKAEANEFLRKHTHSELPPVIKARHYLLVNYLNKMNKGIGEGNQSKKRIDKIDLDVQQAQKTQIQIERPSPSIRKELLPKTISVNDQVTHIRVIDFSVSRQKSDQYSREKRYLSQDPQRMQIKQINKSLEKQSNAINQKKFVLKAILFKDDRKQSISIRKKGKKDNLLESQVFKEGVMSIISKSTENNNEKLAANPSIKQISTQEELTNELFLKRYGSNHHQNSKTHFQDEFPFQSFENNSSARIIQKLQRRTNRSFRKLQPINYSQQIQSTRTTRKKQVKLEDDLHYTPWQDNHEKDRYFIQGEIF